MTSRQHREFEALMGTPVPTDATDVHVHRHQLSTDLSLHTIYAKLRTSREGYLALVSRLGLPRFPSTEPSLGDRLPGAWKLVRSVTLPWWDASPDIPDDTAYRELEGPGEIGFTVAKYENGFAYLVHQRR